MTERIDIVAPALRAYLDEFRPDPDPLLTRLEQEARKEGIPIVSPDTASFLEMAVRMSKPERVLEVGCATGYSAIRMTRAMSSWGHLDTIEVDMDIADRAYANIAEAGLGERVTVLRGPALQLLPTLQHRYDLLFIDAKKSEYEGYLELGLPLLPKGGVVLADNLLWSGRVAVGDFKGDESWRVEATAAIRRFNKVFLTHPELSAQILPIGDGLGVAVKV